MKFVQLVILFFIVSISVIPEAKASFIPKFVRTAAQEHKVPSRVLFAVITHETKRYSSKSEFLKIQPWPWTINHRGKGYYFDSKADAMAHAQKILNSGDMLFDVGIAQINWKWHKHRFKSLSDAFDPTVNIDVAAKILSEQYYENGCNSWLKAVGCYHRPADSPHDRKIAKAYAKKIAKVWREIKHAEREARIFAAFEGRVVDPARISFDHET